MASWGAVINGPSGHAFYAALDRLISRRGAQAVALKIAVDQLVYTPPLTAGFFIFQSLAAGSTTRAAIELAINETWTTLQYNWCFWGVAHVITFAAIPLEHRVAWVALKNFAWSGFLSWRLSSLEQSSSDSVSDAHTSCMPPDQIDLLPAASNHHDAIRSGSW
eukprot:CAMPEP_0183354776 /NCGR_PEP_ID=MMETSP0164_2-20130417/38087_1 /TAXON_ID=221442 /ORGANISM="Coccolithus pelagicus ssp braarudi, Strain PLY182g" /LENGTH=162 /DNA_ID=CAMNT_0025527723 /DNA_START=99 /DNA_END=584 /DNA_ORIENTATION=-